MPIVDPVFNLMHPARVITLALFAIFSLPYKLRVIRTSKDLDKLIMNSEDDISDSIVLIPFPRLREDLDSE